jgi:hypothetical protein
MFAVSVFALRLCVCSMSALSLCDCSVSLCLLCISASARHLALSLSIQRKKSEREYDVVSMRYNDSQREDMASTKRLDAEITRLNTVQEVRKVFIVHTFIRLCLMHYTLYSQ